MASKQVVANTAHQRMMVMAMVNPAEFAQLAYSRVISSKWEDGRPDGCPLGSGRIEFKMNCGRRDLGWHMTL